MNGLPVLLYVILFVNKYTVIYIFFYQVKIPGKRGRPAKNTPGRKKKKLSDDDEDEVVPKNTRGAKPKTPTPTKGRGRTPKIFKSEQTVTEEEDVEDDEELDEEEQEDEDDEYDEEEELNQGPNAKPSKKFTVCVYINIVFYNLKLLLKCLFINLVWGICRS